MDVKTRIAALGLTAAAGLAMYFEGLYLKPYRDPVGILTDCYGHTGPDVRVNKYNTVAECEQKLLDDLVEANDVVDSCVKVPLNRYQRSAWVDFAFNVGHGKKGVKDGMCVLKNGNVPRHVNLLNSRQYDAACNMLPQWANPPLRGIIKRRAAEQALCLTKE